MNFSFRVSLMVAYILYSKNRILKKEWCFALMVIFFFSPFKGTAFILILMSSSPMGVFGGGLALLWKEEVQVKIFQ